MLNLRNIMQILMALVCVGVLFLPRVEAQRGQNPQGKSLLKSSPVFIQGTAPFAAGKNIRLIAFKDLLTYRPYVAAETEVAADGSFQLSFETKHYELVQLAINTSKAEFYVTPGKNYQFNIDMDPELVNQLDPMAYGGYLQIASALPLDTNDINLKINFFDNFTEKVIDYYAPNIIGDLSSAQYDSIDSVINKRFPIQYSPDNFYKSYLYYSMAVLERILLKKQYDSLYHKYLDNEYVLYDNPAYMNFFNEFYDKYFISSSKIDAMALRKCINEECNLLSLFNLVGKDPFLVNERIREIAIIKNLTQLYEDEYFNKANIVKLLTQLSQVSHFEEHRTMAENALHVMRDMEGGSTLEFPHLKAADGSDFIFSDLKGKWVYIQFFNTTCTDCIREMMIINELKKKYGEKIEFVSLSLDFNFGHFIQFMEQYRQFDWHFVHFNDQFAWLEQMHITTLPDNILISPDGTLAQRYAPDITSKLALYLARLFDGKTDDDASPLDPHGKKN